MSNTKQLPWFIGKKIKEVRYLTQKELEDEGWEYAIDPVPVLILTGGGRIYPSCDPEGNGGGMLFGTTKDGQHCYCVPEQEVQDF
jgi:hypothetical protein|tara:strand:+ start:156 stop:410 length:255 start_codon:yes stop_codon:yes gene_type:complete